jgi:hypothetical protein
VISELHATDAENPFKSYGKLLGTAGVVLMFSEVSLCVGLRCSNSIKPVSIKE